MSFSILLVTLSIKDRIELLEPEEVVLRTLAPI